LKNDEEVISQVEFEHPFRLKQEDKFDKKTHRISGVHYEYADIEYISKSNEVLVFLTFKDLIHPAFISREKGMRIHLFEFTRNDRHYFNAKTGELWVWRNQDKNLYRVSRAGVELKEALDDTWISLGKYDKKRDPNKTQISHIDHQGRLYLTNS